MSRAIVFESFGGPEVLELREVPEQHAGPGQVRVRVRAAGLNPIDWVITSDQQTAEMFGVSAPGGFGNDFAGVVDEIGDGVDDFAVGDRVFGGALGRAIAEHLVVDAAALHHTPDGVDDLVASTLDIAAKTATAALAAIRITESDTLLIGGAAGGVGVFAIQLARHAGARVIGTASPESFDFLRSLGAEPVAYGDGLVDRVRALAPEGITAATDLFGTETAYAALELGVPADRISTIAAHDPELTVQATGGGDAEPGTLEHVAGLVAGGDLVVPIAATYPIEQTREAVALQAGRHVKGKVVVTL